MNPAQLLAHFDRVAEAPDAVPRLRRFILDLAVRGKLVEQDAKEESAAELLNCVELVPSQFKIPKNWVSARAGKLLNIQYGKALPAKDRCDQGSVAVFGSNGGVGYCEAALAKEPTIIIGRKGSAGALNLSNGPSWTTDVAYFLIPPCFFNIRFLFVVLQTLDLASLGKGVKPGLNRADAYQLPVVVPPLAEQHRIVAKVDELMALCDELEAAQATREKRRDRLVAATLHGLNNGDASPAPGARFTFHHLPRLTTRPEHIHQLRQTILRLAFLGKLTRSNGDAGSEVTNATSAQIPTTIEWVTLEHACSIIVDSPHRTPRYSANGQYFAIRPRDVSNGILNLDGALRVDDEEFEMQTKRRKPATGDVVYSRELSYGWAAVIPPHAEVCLSQGMVSMRPRDDVVLDFFVMLLNSPLVREQAENAAVGAAHPHVNLKDIRGFHFPLPPLAEQHQIVAKVDELMALCDALEARLTTTATTSRQLLEATLHEALGEAL